MNFSTIPTSAQCFVFHMQCVLSAFGAARNNGIISGLGYTKLLNCTFFSGGFYSDDVGHLGTSCKKCPNGSFVSFHEAPGTETQDCKTCPLGK